MLVEYKGNKKCNYHSMIMQLSEIIIVKSKVQNLNTPLNINNRNNL